jgi:archaellum biogenesis ATPase FlaH
MNDTDPVERVLARLDGVRRESDGGFVARCPAHDDRRPSLRVARGDRGNCLLHCRAGCSTDAVLHSLGLRMADLSAGDSSTWAHDVANGRGRANEPTFATAREAAHAYVARLGKWARSWTYTDAAGEPAGLVLRWDKPDGSKRDIRPVWRIDGRWCLKSPTEARPLFNLDGIGGPGRVFVVEGEKCAELLHSLGFTATTSSGGSAAAHKSEWSSLAGRDVCIVPDADDAGDRYADDVRGICEALDPPARVRIVRLPGLAARSGDDIEQWLSARADREAAADELRALADGAFAAEQDAEPPPGSVSLADLLDDGSIMEPPEVIPSGMVGYDGAMLTGAVEVGTITVWGGEPGAGKSRWMVNLMAAYARRGVRVAYLFGEMTAKRHSQRLLLAQADCGSEVLKSENADNRRRIEDAAREMRGYAGNLRFIAPRLTLEKLTDAAKWADVVCIDALQSVRVHGHSHRHEELEAMFQHCVSLCAEYGTVFQMTSTIAKGDDARTRSLHSAFKGGSEIEQYADYAWFIEEASEHGVQQVRCLKGRDGPKRPFELHTGCGGLRVCTVPRAKGGAAWM